MRGGGRPGNQARRDYLLMPPVISPRHVRMRGFAAPEILQIAHVVMASGWRVTSIYRPGAPSHSKGIALDIAPLIFHAGGFGPQTAALVYQLLCDAGHPNVTVVAEDDHIHIELAARFAPGPGVLTQRGLVMNRYLPESPIGDLDYGDVESGDLFDEHGTPVEIFDHETGDVVTFGEQGGPRRKKHRSLGRRIKRGLKKGLAAVASGGVSLAIDAAQSRGHGRRGGSQAVVPNRNTPPSNVLILPSAKAMGADPLRLSSSAIQKSDPYLNAAVAARKQIQQAAAPDVLFERYVGVGDRVAGELPPNARLRPADVAAASTLIMSNPVFAPQVFAPTTAVVSTITFVLNQVLTAVLPTSTTFDWVGDIIRLTASILNSAPLTFTVTRRFGGTDTTWTYIIPPMMNASELTMFNGRLVAAVPRFAAQAVVVNPVADTSNQIVITGLPVSAYSATLRFLVPGDSQVEGLLSKMV